MSTILAFDTTTAGCSVALFVKGQIQQRFEVAPRRHGELLLPMIDGLLQDAALCITDCDAIAFGCGPGSFMGLRIAAGVAQGLAFGANIPVVPISSLQALAQEAYWCHETDTVLAGWDARMNQIYWGVYQAKQGRMEVLLADQLTPPVEVKLPKHNASFSPCLAAGNAWAIYTPHLPNAIVTLLRPNQDCYPSARAVAFLAALVMDKSGAIDPQAIELIYLRNKVAERPK